MSLLRHLTSTHTQRVPNQLLFSTTQRRTTHFFLSHPVLISSPTMPRSSFNYDPAMMGPGGMFASPEEEFDAQFMYTMGVPAEIRPSVLRRYSTQTATTAERRASKGKDATKKKRDSSDMIENVRVTETVTTTVSVNKDSGYSTKSAADSAADTATETATPKVKRTKSINSVNSLEETAPTKSAEPVKSTKPTKRTTKSTKEVPSGSVKIPWTLRKVLRHAQRDYEAAEAAAKERNEEYKGSPSDILKSEHIERLAALHLPKRYTIHYAKSKKEIDAHIETFLSSEERVFGLDVEWRPQFQKGEKEHRVSLIQICGRNTILLAHIPLNSKTLPPLLNVFLQRRDIYKTGVNIDGDGRKLFRDFNIRTNGLLDIIAVTKHLPPDTLAMTPRRSLRFLTAVLLEKNMAKPKRVQLSNWASPELSESQKRYAALDAYASFKVYETIHEKLEDHSILEGLVAHLEDRDMEAMAAKSAREKHKEKENKAMPTSTTVVIKPSTKEHETVQDLHKKIAPPVQSKSDTVHLSSKKPVEEAVSIERQ